MQTRAAVITIIIAALLSPHPALGWGTTGHELTNQAAADGLPETAPEWLKKAAARLVNLSNDPDRWRLRDLQALDHAQAPDHYVNFELTGPASQLPATRYDYLRHVGARDKEGALKGKPEMAGLALYRAIELAEMLEAQVAALERCPPGTDQRRAAEDAAVTTAGILGHFVADLANPHHTTIHHDGWKGSNEKGYRTQRGFHSEFEEKYLDRVAKLEQVRELVAKPAAGDDYRKVVMEHAERSHALVEKLYELEKEGAFKEGAAATDAGKAGAKFLHDRLAAGAAVLRDLWVAACAKGAARAHKGRFSHGVRAVLERNGFKDEVQIVLEGDTKVILRGELPEERRALAEKVAKDACKDMGAVLVSELKAKAGN